MKKLKVAVLDDYQHVALDFADWEKLSENIELKVFNEYIGAVSYTHLTLPTIYSL